MRRHAYTGGWGAGPKCSRSSPGRSRAARPWAAGVPPTRAHRVSGVAAGLVATTPADTSSWAARRSSRRRLPSVMPRPPKDERVARLPPVPRSTPQTREYRPAPPRFCRFRPNGPGFTGARSRNRRVLGIALPKVHVSMICGVPALLWIAAPPWRGVTIHDLADDHGSHFGAARWAWRPGMTTGPFGNEFITD